MLINALKDTPVGKKMRGSKGSVERHSRYEEGGFMGYTAASISKSGLIDYSEPLGAMRVVAFVRAFKLVNKQWLHDLAQACHRDLSSCTEDMRSPYWECYSDPSLCADGLRLRPYPGLQSG